jgi:hypothetical protein
VTLGSFRLRVGDAWPVRVSRVAPGHGFVVADAVRIQTR